MKKEDTSPGEGDMRLNKYLAHAGIASRRKADELIAEGLVTVNGVVVKEMGHRVTKDDVIKFKGKTIIAENFVYILLNKPKDYITTTSDERDRKTVMELIAGACKERVYPVGRLDRNTTGLLLLTNDGDLMQKLTHPSKGVKKVYQATLNKPLTKVDMEKIGVGVELEDGLAKVDAIAYADAHDKREIGIEIHIGKNRVVRRIFEHLGYDVVKLDRVLFAELTKKNLQRGKWRFLREKEVTVLKHLM
jgi:23S rRNA pseudouridine2605 synthase